MSDGTNPGLSELLALIVTFLVCALFYYKWKFNYWHRTGLYSCDVGIPFGNATKLVTAQQSFCDMINDVYSKFKSRGLKHGGFYLGTSPCYMPLDPKIIKSITIQDFQYFTNHGGYVNEIADPLGAHLFNLVDDKWKSMRSKLTPVFTSGKIRMMFQTLQNCARELSDVIQVAAEAEAPIEIKDIMARYTTDVIGSTAFGLECNSLKDPNSTFRKYGKRIVDNSIWDLLKLLMQNFLPDSVLKFIKFKLTKPDVEHFFMKAVRDTVNYRETNSIYRKDFMHLLLQLKNRGELSEDADIKIKNGNIPKGEGVLTMNELAAQAFVFFVAGFETSSTTMTFLLLELALHPHVQDKLREEIRVVLKKYNNEVVYDAIMEITYLDQVLCETLRKYPPLPFLPRVCNQDYKLPNTEIVIGNGAQVFVPVFSIQNDPEYYPNPEVFDPDRFTPENIQKRPDCTWIPFGLGPRICIGLRFGKLQSKVGLVNLLSNYKFTIHEKTKTPVTFAKSSVILTVEGGVWLNVEPVQ